MQNSFELRIRHPEGSTQLNTLNDNSSIYDLKQEISKLLQEPMSSLILKKGYPPRIFDLPEPTTLSNSEISSGETIVVEVDNSKTTTNPVKSDPKQTKSDPKKLDSTIPKQPPSNKDGMIMIRRIIPADNSCLFNSIAYAMENKAKNKASDIRKIVALSIKADPTKYSDVLLEKPNDQYVQWILKDSSWGGAIELEILSNHYKVEISAVDIISLNAQVFGSDKGYKKRIYVLYDGIHYDILARNITEDFEIMPDVTIFSSDDQSAMEGAMYIAKDLHNKKQFTDMGNFSIECGVCYKKFTGEKEAVVHNKESGHANFHEIGA